MKPKKAAKKFLKLLAKELDLPKGSTVKRLRQLFEGSVKVITNAELQAELINNVDDYLSLLSRYVSEINRESEEVEVSEIINKAEDEQEEKSNVDIEKYPYNLYLTHGQLKDTSQHDFPVYRCYLSQSFDETLVEKITNDINKDIEQICNVTLGSTVPFENVMLLFHRKLSDIVEKVIAEKKYKGIKDAENKLLKYLLYFHIKSEAKYGSASPSAGVKYEDIVAALLSLYADVACINTRNLEESELKQEQRKLVMLVDYMLRSSQQHMMDVIIQMTQLTDVDTAFLMPLIRKVIEKPPFSLKDPEIYTKYVLTVHKLTSSLGEEVEHLKKMALGVKAPKRYLDWLGEKDHEILGDMPDNIPNFKGVNITRYILEEANEETLERLLNLLTVDESALPDDEEESEEHAVDNGSNDLPNEEMFFMDKSSNQAISATTVDEPEEEEEIVIDDAMLDRELAAMDEKSEQSDMSDDDSETGKKGIKSSRSLLDDTSKALNKIGEEESSVEDSSEDESEPEDEEEMDVDEGISQVIAGDSKSLKKSPKKLPESDVLGKTDSTEETSDGMFFVDKSADLAVSRQLQDVQPQKNQEQERSPCSPRPTWLRSPKYCGRTRPNETAKPVKSPEISPNSRLMQPTVHLDDVVIDMTEDDLVLGESAQSLQTKVIESEHNDSKSAASPRCSSRLRKMEEGSDKTINSPSRRQNLGSRKDVTSPKSLSDEIVDVESEVASNMAVAGSDVILPSTDSATGKSGNSSPKGGASPKKSKQFLERGIAKSVLVGSGDDSSSAESPRRTRRSLVTPKKPPPAETLTLDSSSKKKAKFVQQDEIEIYDLSSIVGSDTTFSEIESPQKTDIRTPRKTASLAKKLLSRQAENVDSGSDTSGLSISEITGETSKRSSRIRTASQTSGISVMSEESVSFFTRSKSRNPSETVVEPLKSPTKETPSRTSTRRSMQASPLSIGRSKNPVIVIDDEGSSSPAKANKNTRRRSVQSLELQKEGAPTPKKQKVGTSAENSPRKLRSSAKQLSSPSS